MKCRVAACFDHIKGLGKIWAVVLVLGMAAGWQTPARASAFGLGLQLVDITGFTAKTYLKRNRAVEAALGWKDADRSLTILLSAHYLFIFPKYIKIDGQALDAYFGLGARIPSHGYWTEVRLPFGVAYQMRQIPLEPYGELIPGLSIFPNTSLQLSIALGLRYFF